MDARARVGNNVKNTYQTALGRRRCLQEPARLVKEKEGLRDGMVRPIRVTANAEVIVSPRSHPISEPACHSDWFRRVTLAVANVLLGGGRWVSIPRRNKNFE